MRHRAVRSALAACIVVAPLTISAQERPATPAMLCADAAALVNRVGAIVMTTGPITYDRIVRDGGFCPLPEAPKPAYELTRDVAQCFVGYVCRDKFNEGSTRD